MTIRNEQYIHGLELKCHLTLKCTYSFHIFMCEIKLKRTVLGYSLIILKVL